MFLFRTMFLLYHRQMHGIAIEIPTSLYACKFEAFDTNVGVLAGTGRQPSSLTSAGD